MSDKPSHEELQERIQALERQLAAADREPSGLHLGDAEYRWTLDNLLVGVVVHAADTSILYSNPEASRILGLSKEQMTGKTAIDPAWHFTHEDGTIMAVADYPVSKVFATAEPLHNYLVGINRPDREHLTWAMVNAIPVFSANNQLEKAIINFVDVTDRKRVEEENVELARQLRQSQKMEALGTLAGGIAHDFNNLLTPIMGYSDLIRHQGRLCAEDLECLGHVEESARRARDLVEKILVFSRASSPHRQAVRLANLVEEVLVVLRASAPPTVRIDTRIEDDLPAISVDPSQIHQVMLNLCINAIQAMPRGGELTITVQRAPATTTGRNHDRHAAESILLSISDTGCGMDPDTLEHAYDPFFTTKQKGAKKGTGLGLAIVASIIDQHDGRIEARSVPGRGTTFDVYLPLANVTVTAPKPAAPATELPTGSRILLIDDERMVNDLTAVLLRRLGFAVQAFDDGVSALMTFSADPDAFDLVITDYSMPQIQGPELIAKVRALRPTVPVILVSGYSDLAIAADQDLSACDAIIAKPFDLETLRETIATVFSRSAS